MIAPGLPGPPDMWGRIWNPVYEFGYGALRAVVLFFARPLFLVRTIGPRPRLPRGASIVCANHASYLDPAFLQLVIRRRVVFMMTDDFYRRWAGRWFFKLVGAIPVGSGGLARAGIGRAVALLREGQPVAIFPEGRLSRDGKIGRGRRGVAILARKGRAPVVPVGLAGNFETWPRGARWFRRAHVRLAFGAPLAPPPADVAGNREAETAYVERIMEAIQAARARALAAGTRPARRVRRAAPGPRIEGARVASRAGPSSVQARLRGGR